MDYYLIVLFSCTKRSIKYKINTDYTIKTNMKSLYVCHTPYHLLISIIKELITPTNSILLLCESSNLEEFTKIQLNDSSVFTQFIDKGDLEKKHKYFRVVELLFKKKSFLLNSTNEMLSMYGDEHRDTNIYIFNDTGAIGYWIVLNKLNYHLIEDGLDCFKYDSFKLYGKKVSLKYKIATLFNGDVLRWGLSKYALDIEVNDAEGIQLQCPKEKLIVKPRKELFSQLTPSQKKIIIDIFCSDEIKQELYSVNDSNVSLLITQPLSEDKYMSEEQKIKVYLELANQATGKLIVKPHPREKTDYSAIFPDAIVLKCNKVPLEVFSFFDNIRFAKALTAFSTCVDAIDFVDEKISWGVEKTLAFAKENS